MQHTTAPKYQKEDIKMDNIGSLAHTKQDCKHYLHFYIKKFFQKLNAPTIRRF